jgi:hypothetical protein
MFHKSLAWGAEPENPVENWGLWDDLGENQQPDLIVKKID